MNGYSMIKLAGSTKSTSIDLSDDSDFLSFSNHHHQSPKPIESLPIPNNLSKTLETKRIINPFNTHLEDEEDDQDGINNGGEKRLAKGGILTRNFSVSSSSSSSTAAYSHRFTLQYSAVKRAISMRRSSSVSERYFRIHDQCVTLDSSIDGDGGDQGMEARSVKKKKKMMMKQQSTGGKILKVCKRIFGL
ncbi:hypothetical protein U1Q18_003195 [Sarracenia purpurea var. burkii]